MECENDNTMMEIVDEDLNGRIWRCPECDCDIYETY